MLLVQRLPDKHDPGEAYARWELPGGFLSPTDPSIWDGAVREWSEETGATLPDGTEPSGGWISDDGEYEGFVVQVPSEDALDLAPQPEEVSQVGWWDVEDLSDPKVREKVQEVLDQIVPLLQKASWEQAHPHADRIIDHYTPVIQDALASAYSADVVRQAARAAYGISAATKARGTGTTKQTAKQRAQAVLNQAVATAPGQAIAVGGAALGGIAVGGTAGAALAGAVTAIYGSAAVQGAEWALLNLGAAALVPLWLLALRRRRQGNVPGTGDQPWEPEVGDEAVEEIASYEADKRIGRTVANAGQVSQGVLGTLAEHIADMIATDVAEGKPMDLDDIVARARALGADEAHARLIAETEYARLMTLAARETYRRNGITMIEWLHQPGACHRCLVNAAASPIPIYDQWPEGDVPVHPNCRCAEAPVVTVQRRPVL